jgi:hypothetical protein
MSGYPMAPQPQLRRANATMIGRARPEDLLPFGDGKSGIRARSAFTFWKVCERITRV